MNGLCGHRRDALGLGVGLDVEASEEGSQLSSRIGVKCECEIGSNLLRFYLVGTLEYSRSESLHVARQNGVLQNNTQGPISHRLEYMLTMLISLPGLIMGAFGLARSTSHQFRDAGRIDGFGGSPGSAMAAAWRRPASRRPSRRVCGDGGFLEFTTSPWGQETRFCMSLLSALVLVGFRMNFCRLRVRGEG